GSNMLQLFAFRRSLRVLALALCSASFAVVTSPASARPHHGRHARGYHAGHHARHHVHRHYGHRHIRHIRAFSSEVDPGSRQENASNKKSRASRGERGVARMETAGLADSNITFTTANFADPNSTLTPPGGVMPKAGASASSLASSSDSSSSIVL